MVKIGQVVGGADGRREDASWISLHGREGEERRREEKRKREVVKRQATEGGKFREGDLLLFVGNEKETARKRLGMESEYE